MTELSVRDTVGDAGERAAHEHAADAAIAGRATAAARETPLLQTLRIAFTGLRLATLALFVAWAFGNVRTVAPGTQAVTLRFGRIAGVTGPGLLLAWPRPFERVVVLPGGDRQMPLAITVPATRPAPPDDGEAVAPADAVTVLTGDGGVLLLQARLTWRIADAGAYLLAADHVPAALRRLFLAASLDEAASHELDDFLSVRPERANDPDAEASRARVRLRLAARMNARLADLAHAGSPLGVGVTRIDLTPLLPPTAKPSFDAVLDAAQRADQALATERTEAALTRQQADRDRDRAIADAHAAADERIARAGAATATIAAVAARASAQGRDAVLAELYRTRVGAVLRAAGRVDAVPAGGDPAHPPRLLLPGPKP